MEAFNKFAGVSEVSSSSGGGSKPLPAPPPIPQTEPAPESLSRRASRASLPRDLQRSPSRRSLHSVHQVASARRSEDIPPVPTTPLSPGFASARQSTRQSARPGTSAESEALPPGRTSHESAASGSQDFDWGPSHPCFPHPNPHCLPDSDEFANTRVIRVRRDWLAAGDLYPQFQNLYPEILDPLVSDSDFRFLVTNINARLETMFDPRTVRAWADAILGVLTGFFWDDLGLAATKKGVQDLEQYIDRWNGQKANEKQEIRLVQPRRTGFLTLDFIIPDPGLDTTDQSKPPVAPRPTA